VDHLVGRDGLRAQVTQGLHEGTLARGEGAGDGNGHWPPFGLRIQVRRGYSRSPQIQIFQRVERAGPQTVADTVPAVTVALPVTAAPVTTVTIAAAPVTATRLEVAAEPVLAARTVVALFTLAVVAALGPVISLGPFLALPPSWDAGRARDGGAWRPRR
jgi:hypothetical protein